MTEELKNKVKILLKINDTDIYDEELEVEIDSSMAKMEIEGVPMAWAETKVGTPYFSLYAVCVAYLCSGLLDGEIDINKLQRQYITNTNELRTYYSYEMSINA